MALPACWLLAVGKLSVKAVAYLQSAWRYQEIARVEVFFFNADQIQCGSVAGKAFLNLRPMNLHRPYAREDARRNHLKLHVGHDRPLP